MYLGIFKWKHHRATLLTCFLLAGAPLIPMGLIGLPTVIGWLAGIGIAVYILSQYTEVEILPTGVLIIVSVEIVYALLERLIIAPYFYF